MDSKSKMIQDKNKKYYHVEVCYPLFLKEKEFRQLEAEKKTKLAEKIAEIHGLESIQLIPHTFYPLIEDIRNDSQLFGKLKKQYKKGLPYEAISYTYEYCRDKIRWAIQNKEFKNKLSELKYCLAIVKNNLADAKEDATRKKRQEAEREQLKSDVEQSEPKKEYVYNKKQSDDISLFM